MLQRLEQGALDGALLPLPIEGCNWIVQQVASNPLVACMRMDEPLSSCTDYLLRYVPVLRGWELVAHRSDVSLGLETRQDNAAVPMGSRSGRGCRVGRHGPVL